MPRDHKKEATFNYAFYNSNLMIGEIKLDLI